MNLIEKLEKISAKIFQQTIKNYKFKDIVAHRHAKPHNLVQYLAMYPGRGVGFHVWRKGWPKNMYIKVTSTEFKSNRLGKIRGMKYMSAKQMWHMPKRVPGVSKRGIWQYDAGEARDIQLDNGVVYTKADFQFYMKNRRSWLPKKKAAQEVAGQQTQQQPPQQGQQQSSNQSEPAQAAQAGQK